MFRDRFKQSRVLIGVVHVGALPGTARANEPVAVLTRHAADEARIYEDAGFDAVIIENMHDRPYLKGGAGPEITSAMTAIGCEIRRHTQLALGVQVLAGANREAMAVAHACGGDFVRVEGYVFAHVADEGVIESSAGELLRYRRAIGAESVLVFADIKKKHSAHAITADVSLVETAHAAEFFLADGVIVSGAATGIEASPQDVRVVAEAVGVPVLVGSGMTPANVARFVDAHGFIVGSAMKHGGRWDNPLDRHAAEAMARAVAALGQPS